MAKNFCCSQETENTKETANLIHCEKELSQNMSMINYFCKMINQRQSKVQTLLSTRIIAERSHHQEAAIDRVLQKNVFLKIQKNICVGVSFR